MEILTGEQMRRVDRRAIDAMGIASLLLMEAAGAGVADRLRGREPDACARGVLVLAGKGNNGADGLVVARHLVRRGIPARAILFARAASLRGDAAVQLAAARASGVAVEEAATEAAWTKRRGSLDRCGIVLDALLGTGIHGGARGVVAGVIEDLNATATRVVSLDLPSGLDADATEVVGPTVQADRTWTLCRPKLPLAIGPSSLYAGLWEVVPIGIPDSAVEAEKPELEWLDDAAVRDLVAARSPDSHKGTYGHLLVVGGSRGKSGAVVLVAGAALRAGVGLVTAAVPSGSLPVVAAQRAEMMTEPLPQTPRSGVLGKSGDRAALRLLAERDALALGPGLGVAAETREAVRAIVRGLDRPAVIDADGLNAFARRGGRAPGLRAGPGGLVLTPHPGEAARLLDRATGEVQADRLAAARTLAERTGAVVALKGHRTVVAAPDGRAAINGSGNPGMATGGTGDVLTGVVGAALARGLDPWNAARLAVYVHGDAGDRVARVRGMVGLVAGDVVEAIADALRALEGPGEIRPW